MSWNPTKDNKSGFSGTVLTLQSKEAERSFFKFLSLDVGEPVLPFAHLADDQIRCVNQHREKRYAQW